jgi:hypothetical protein
VYAKRIAHKLRFAVNCQVQQLSHCPSVFALALDDSQALGVGGKVGNRVVCLAAMMGNRKMAIPQKSRCGGWRQRQPVPFQLIELGRGLSRGTGMEPKAFRMLVHALLFIGQIRRGNLP